MRHFACAALVFLVLGAGGGLAGQEKTVTPPPSITTEGIPPIPQSIADGLAKYAQFRQAQMMAWNPSKRQIVVTTNLGSVPQLYLVDGPGRDRHQLTWLQRGVPTWGNVSFDPVDPNTLIFQFDPAGSELRSLYRYDLGTGETSLLMESKTRFAHVWSRQGKWLAYDSAERNGKDRDLYVMQPSDPKTKRRLADFDGPYAPQDWSPDGTTLLANEILANDETYLWRVDVKSGAKTAITARNGEKSTWLNARFSPDGKKVYALSDRQGGLPRIWRCDVANCVWAAVSGPGVTIDIGSGAASGGFELSPDGTLLAAVVDKGAYTDLQLIDLTTLKPRTLPPLPKGIITQLRWRPASRELAFSFASIKSQGDVYSVDASLGTLARWTNSETSFNPDVLPAPELIEFKSFDGVAINAILYRPAAKFTGPRPVLVQLHGGPDLRARIQWMGRSNYLLNELGMAIVFPNVRGSGGFGREFAQMDDGKRREGAIKDVGALLDWMGTRPELDKSRVVLSGASYGGWLALEAGIVYNSRIRGIIEGAGITDFITYLERDTNPARQENRRAEYGDERDPGTHEFLKSISPITRAADLKKPTFILQPGQDIRVPPAQARELLNALKANNATVWYAEFANTDHDNFPGTNPNNDWMLAAWVAFYKAFLLN